MAQIEQKRIAQLTLMEDEGVDQLIESTAKSSKWAMAVDYVVGDGETQVNDQGTKHITVDRLGLLTKSRLVPQSMLPHKMDSIIDGRMRREGSGATEKWTFEDANTGDKYVCPGPPGEGELRPSIDTIYRDKDDPDNDHNYTYTQYRYVPTDNEDVGTEDETGNFVPIPSDLVMVNGAGTTVSDNLTNYTRQVDLLIGIPCNPVNDVLAITEDDEISHSKSGVTSGLYPQQSEPSVVGFGTHVYVPGIVVNSTGHVTGATTYDLTIPNTAATSGASATAGLVKIGTNIQPIGSSNDSGTVSPTGSKPYVEVAAVDHVHKASTLTLNHVNTPNNASLIYNGAANVEYDFDNILHARLPASSPEVSGKLLGSKITNSLISAEWCDPAELLIPEYAMVDIVSGSSIGSAATVLQLDTTPPIRHSVIEITTNAFTGINGGKSYVMCIHLGLSPTAPITSLVDATIKVQSATSTSAQSWIDNAEAKYVLDGSITGIPNYINGQFIIGTDDDITALRVTLQCDVSTWTLATGGNIQIAEVK